MMRNRIKNSLHIQDFSEYGASLRNASPSIFKLDLDNDFEQRFTELEQIGEGGSAVVKRCLRKSDNVYLAAKIMRKYDSEKEENSRREFDLLYSLSHPNIVEAYEFIATDGWTYMITELASGHDLSKGEVPKHEVKSVMKQLLEAMAYLHQQGICHNDLKPENVIYCPDTTIVKLIDFNISQKMGVFTS
jgi:serine/threonine protein kinase